ncbi:hypothetical protein QTH89_10550 [Variovorax sp. J22G21]|nr:MULTISPECIES: hypothetical protein [unclassified Variovorax]MDM0040268.1 hypothetical protein [Variovorax sp. J22R193]MDM0061641.1 hypothetical protein [Variovorax sp. J22G21]
MSAIACHDRNALIVVCGFDFAIHATLSLAIAYGRLRGFSLASLIDSDAHHSFWRINSNCPPPTFPLLGGLLRCSLLSVIRPACVETGTRAISNLTGRTLLGKRGAAQEHPETCHQQSVQEMC